MTPDLEKLRAIVRAEPIVQSLLDAVLKAKLKGRFTRLETVHRHMRGGKMGLAQFQELLAGFRLLASCGMGQVERPTVRGYARFAWAVRPQVVRDLAANAAMTLQPGDVLDAAILQPAAVVAPALPAGCRRHTFELRPELEVTLTLPADLTEGEARRLGHLLLALAREP
jgi:hypothetical protein